MPSNCPICDQPIPSTVAHCAVCGFPAALAIEALRSIGPDGATASEPEAAAAPASSPVVVAPPSPEAELCAAISRDLRGKLEYVRELGRGAPDVTSDMCQAALSEADGRVTEALEVLRRAQRSLDRQTDELLARRLQSVETREEALRKTGGRFALSKEIARLKEAVDLGRRDVAGRLLVEAERRLSQFESDWRGLQGLLQQIETLRGEANDLGVPLEEISNQVTEIRDQLREGDLTESALDSIAQGAAQTLMLLHEVVPNSLAAELKRQGDLLDGYPEEHRPAAAARRLHAEATRHLRKGRLTDAIQSVRDLRREVERLEQEREAAAIAVAPEVPAPIPPPEESEEETLARLLQKARTLAGRVRTLPPDSEVARDAAVQIREVTDLLRSHQVRRADETLARLMRILSAQSEEFEG